MRTDNTSRRPSWILLLLTVLAATACDRERKDARSALDQWLTAHVARDFVKVVALTTDATFATVARQQGVAIAQVRKDMPQLLALAPEKLTGYAIGDGERSQEGVYAFLVSQKTLKGKLRGEKREKVFVVREAERWRIDPTRTVEAKGR